MLDDGLDEQMVRIVEAAVSRGIERMRELNLSPDVFEFVEGQMRAAATTAGRALRRHVTGGQKH
ncbi:hypothetical protein [Variovorax sp. LjRoot175]|uniref:hypothetical protein n=1 Tax=Variovorax sp. LjRoot175 TaxID=3342276 RepID=UPI003F51278D